MLIVKIDVGMYDPLGHFVYFDSHGGFSDENESKEKYDASNEF